MNVFITKAIEKVADAAKVFGEKITSGKDKDQANKELTETITGAMNAVIKDGRSVDEDYETAVILTKAHEMASRDAMDKEKTFFFLVITCSF